MRVMKTLDSTLSLVVPTIKSSKCRKNSHIIIFNNFQGQIGTSVYFWEILVKLIGFDRLMILWAQEAGNWLERCSYLKISGSLIEWCLAPEFFQLAGHSRTMHLDTTKTSPITHSQDIFRNLSLSQTDFLLVFILFLSLQTKIFLLHFFPQYRRNNWTLALISWIEPLWANLAKNLSIVTFTMLVRPRRPSNVSRRPVYSPHFPGWSRYFLHNRNSLELLHFLAEHFR
jgi:hypothetical protein